MEIRVSIYDAKTQLSALVDKAIAGDEVIITRRGKAVARVTAAEQKNPVIFGLFKNELPAWDPQQDDAEIRELFSEDWR